MDMASSEESRMVRRPASFNTDFFVKNQSFFIIITLHRYTAFPFIGQFGSLVPVDINIKPVSTMLQLTFRSWRIKRGNFNLL